MNDNTPSADSANPKLWLEWQLAVDRVLAVGAAADPTVEWPPPGLPVTTEKLLLEFSPSRLLAEIEAKYLVLEQYPPELVVRIMCAAYDHRPGWREEWRTW